MSIVCDRNCLNVNSRLSYGWCNWFYSNFAYPLLPPKWWWGASPPPPNIFPRTVRVLETWVLVSRHQKAQFSKSWSFWSWTLASWSGSRHCVLVLVLKKQILITRLSEEHEIIVFWKRNTLQVKSVDLYFTQYTFHRPRPHHANTYIVWTMFITSEVS